MSCYIRVAHDQADAEIYGMLVGCGWKDRFTDEEHKEWDLFLYNTPKGRQQGARNQALRTPNVDLIFLEMRLTDLIKTGRLTPVPPLRDRRVPEHEVQRFIDDKRKRK